MDGKFSAPPSDASINRPIALSSSDMCKVSYTTFIYSCAHRNENMLVAYDTSGCAEAEHGVPPQSDVDEFLRKKRKAREHKACYPCRQRKVKCDLTRPCQTCRDRDHPELCSYHPPNKRQSAEQGQNLKTEDHASGIGSFGSNNFGNGSVTLGRSEFDMLCTKLNGLEKSISELRQQIQTNAHARQVTHETSTPTRSEPQPGSEGRLRRPTHTDVHGIHTTNEQGEIVHLGGGSIPAMLYSLGQGLNLHNNNNSNGTQGGDSSWQDSTQVQELLGKSVLSLFGMDNESSTYPFVDLWGLPHASLQRAEELAKALPNDQQLLSLSRSYRDTSYVIFPGIADMEQFEESLTLFLVNRASQSESPEGVTEQQIYGRTYGWLGMLFAVLASGAQCSTMPRKERELTSQVYVCCSFECLRFTNFLSQPHMECIQALLIIGNVMTNNMNAGSAWSLLGLTIRLAQGLGLHRACPPNVPDHVVYPRSKIWWAILWQDSLLSITYDRSSSTSSGRLNTMPMPQRFGMVGPYHSIMYRVCKVALDIVRDRVSVSNEHERYATIRTHRDAIFAIMDDSAEYLRNSRACTSPRETLEHWALYLHTSYALSELCRPSISRDSDHELAKPFKELCIDNLANTVEAFLGLHNISTFARQSWAALHRSLSSALLLGILGEHTRSERVRKLISRFITVSLIIKTTIDANEVSVPVLRGIQALQKLDLRDPNAPVEKAEQNGYQISPETGSNDADGSSMAEPAPFITPGMDMLMPEDDTSPYSVLNAILWGNTDFNQDAEVFAV
ncbi:Hypothetical protein R9X50_00322900 [Acrodontium crateriforme]|uniref:Zn(2)-C6 fungal-type domain-containing protein n=1 Tax=Acrodontium crateriforme TaxID=150365 RepID=A0AAQ3M266_9PEZI|nr:Hypothetical protein R9X50_00322900 [Acrodontium crateriforme]